MSIFGMVSDYLKRQLWGEIAGGGEARNQLRALCVEVANASDSDSELRAMKRLARFLDA